MMMGQALAAGEVGRWLDDLLSTMQHPKAAPALKAWGQELAGALGVGFLRSVSPAGKPWRPLKRPRPRGHNPGSRPLIDFGDMMLSVIGSSPDHIEDITDDSISFGTKDKKAAFHQFGTRYIPSRPFVGVSDEMADRAAEILTEHQIHQISLV